MKIDRRSFLSFVIGGAAGTALSPLPWKLTDDLSIWTQTWPWTPVPPNGEAWHVNSVCTLCPGGCGISVRKIDERAVKIEGMADHPVNHGGVCILGLSGLQLLYGPSRVKAPMKRIGERGQGRWKEISWNQAVAEVARKLADIRAQEAPEKVACISGAGCGTVSELFKRFMTAYGSPNFFTVPSMEESYSLTLKYMQGTDSVVGFDAENADFILSFGSGFLEGWGSPVRMFRANSLWKESKAAVVQIEPRLSNTAAKSDRWLVVNPGTEAALALGLAHVIIKESLYDKTFIKDHAFGFEGWTDDDGKKNQGFKDFVLDNFSLEAVARVTGMDASTITSLAKNFAGASKPLALCGRGKGGAPGSLHEFFAVHALNALTGNINKEGGVWALPKPDYFGWDAPGLDKTAEKGVKTARIDGAGGKRFPHTASILSRLPEAVNATEGSGVEALLVVEANPLYTLPDTANVQKALGKIPFIVSFSSYMDETARMADIILPNHMYLERYEDVPAPSGLQKPVIGITRPAVRPQFNTQHAGDAVMMIARELPDGVSGAFPWDNYEACLEATFGDNWETLMEDGIMVNADFTPAAWDEAFAATPSGKFEFFTAAYRHGEKTDAAVQIEIEGEETAYPLILVPYDSMRLASGYIGDTPFMIKTVSDEVLKDKDVFVEVNPVTASKYGLKDGASALLSTPRGEATVRINHSQGVMPGLVAMPRGLGHTAYSKYLAEKGINFNQLIGPVQDPVSGLDAAWGIRAKLLKA